MPKRTRIAGNSAKAGNIVVCPNCGQKVVPLKNAVCPACRKPMAAEQKAPRANSGAKSRAAPITLYTPRQVFTLSLLTGWPSGLVLASVNWTRTGASETALIHWVAGAFFLTVWSFALASVSGGTLLDLAIQFGVSLYLYGQMRNIQKTCANDGTPVQPASWKSGCLLALISLVIFVVLMVLLVVLFTSKS